VGERERDEIDLRARAGEAAWRGSWLAVLLPLLAGGAALAVSWQRWIDPFVDSGREMDVPWRLTLGERLYHDITYYYGPLGPWLNAFALRSFGHRWMVLQAICLLLSIVILALLYQLTRQAGGRWAAVTAVTLSAALCMGAPRGAAFIFPYSSSGLLALAGGLLALWAACRPAGSAGVAAGSGAGRPPGSAGDLQGAPALAAASGAGLPPRPLLRGAAVVGLAVALAARLEVGIAAAAVLVLAGIRSRPRRETLRQSLGVVSAASLLAGSLYAAALWGLEWREIRYDGPLTHLAGMPPEWKNFYLEVSGFDRPARHAGHAVLSLALDAALLALLGWFALPASRGARRRQDPAARTPEAGENGAPEAAGSGPSEPRAAAPAQESAERRRRYLFPFMGLALLAAYLESPFADPSKNLPPLTPALPLLAAAAAAALLRRPLASQDRARFLLFGFSAAMALRVVLDLPLGPRMGPYASLPLPGLLATAAVLAFDALAPRLPDPATFRRRLVALLAVVCGLFLYRVDRLDQQPRPASLETSAGTLRLPAREARAVDHALRYLAGRSRAGDELTAFPESGFFNFVTGMRSPLRQDQIFPGVLSGEREVEVARLIDRAGPRFVLLCNRPTPEYGPARFGADYDLALWHEIERRYALAATFGRAPPTAPGNPERFLIRVYERLAPPALAPMRLAERAPTGGESSGSPWPQPRGTTFLARTSHRHS
jgi:4-amino-4-deoxy-L-arabinose transferase-like glycosyltransferase